MNFIYGLLIGLAVGAVVMYIIGKHVKNIGPVVAPGVVAGILLGGVYGISKYNPETGVLESLPVAVGAKIDTVQVEDWMPKELLRFPLDSGNTWALLALRNDTIIDGVVGTAVFSYDMRPKIIPNRLNEKGIRGK